MLISEDFEKYKSENQNEFNEFNITNFQLVGNERWLFFATANGHLPIVVYLVSIGCDPKVRKNRAIQLAIINGHLSIAMYLVSVGCNPTADNNCSIKWAVMNGHLHIIKYLVSIGWDPKTNNNLAIRRAAMYCRLSVVRYLEHPDITHEKRKKFGKLGAILSDKFDIFKGVIRDLAEKV
jgi:ankyrin repeat protein